MRSSARAGRSSRLNENLVYRQRLASDAGFEADLRAGPGLLTAYAIAAGATVFLISSYAQSHFKNIKTTLVLGAAMALLYSFIFVLIRLEDTALLVGSIGLFIVLALVMYASRKVNWYGNK